MNSDLFVSLLNRFLSTTNHRSGGRLMGIPTGALSVSRRWRLLNGAGRGFSVRTLSEEPNLNQLSATRLDFASQLIGLRFSLGG